MFVSPAVLTLGGLLIAFVSAVIAGAVVWGRMAEKIDRLVSTVGKLEETVIKLDKDLAVLRASVRGSNHSGAHMAVEVEEI